MIKGGAIPPLPNFNNHPYIKIDIGIRIRVPQKLAFSLSSGLLYPRFSIYFFTMRSAYGPAILLEMMLPAPFTRYKQPAIAVFWMLYLSFYKKRVEQ